MKARSGQVALYLLMVLVAIAVLMFANVNLFLAVRSKNRMMNAVDAAALAVARHLGALLNEVGRLNVEHLRAAVCGKEWIDEIGQDRMRELRELVLTRPLEGVRLANDAARAWGFDNGVNNAALASFYDHLAEIKNNPEFYPRTGEDDAWGDYASALERALAGATAVLPSFSEMVNPGARGLFANHTFYDAIEANAWCWFTIGDNAGYLNQDPSSMESAEIVPVEMPVNSEIFSLHLEYRPMTEVEEWYVPNAGFTEAWTNFVCQVTGLTREEFSPSARVEDADELWAFYEENPWSKWSKTFNPNTAPIAGALKPEYDVAGCVASCRIFGDIVQLDDFDDDAPQTMCVTAAAKPFGTVRTGDGDVLPVTAFHGFVAASEPDGRIFTEAQLVLYESVPHGENSCDMEDAWYTHVKKHSPRNLASGCGLCSLWRQWSNPAYRAKIRNWLKKNGETCQRGGGDAPVRQGGLYAH